MAVKHNFTSAVADGADATLVRPSNWNADHTVEDGTITYAKIQNVSATDKLLGRSTAGAGVVEEIACTAAGRAILDDADAAAQRTTLGAAASSHTHGLADITDEGALASLNTVGTAQIDNDAVTYAKIQNVSATDRLLGRDSALAGDVEELTVGGGIEFTGAGGIQTSALTGDVTKSAGGTATTIAANAVLNTMLRDSAANSIIGRAANSSGDPADIAAANANEVLKLVGTSLAFSLLGVPQIIIKASDETVNNSSVLQDDNELITGTLATGSYVGVVIAAYDSNTTADIKLTLSHTGVVAPSRQLFFGLDGAATSTTGSLKTVSPGFGNARDFGGGGATTIANVAIWFTFTSSTTGQLVLQWAQQTANASDTVLKAGSFMLLIKVS